MTRTDRESLPLFDLEDRHCLGELRGLLFHGTGRCRCFLNQGRVLLCRFIHLSHVVLTCSIPADCS